jgi:hypothetical protein
MQHLKKITLLSLLFVSAFSYAQETGPSKEVTVQAINKYMNETVGMKWYLNYLKDENGAVLKDENGNYLFNDFEYSLIESVKFTLEEIVIKHYRSEVEGTSTRLTNYSNMNWDNIKNIDTTVIVTNEKKNSEIASIKISFYSKYKTVYSCIPGTLNVFCDQTEYYDNLYIYIPKNRVAACYKALIHLKELCTEEDPFEDH